MDVKGLESLARTQGDAVVEARHLANLHAILQRTDAAAFRDAQNMLFILIDSAWPMPTEPDREST